MNQRLLVDLFTFWDFNYLYNLFLIVRFTRVGTERVYANTSSNHVIS